MATKDESTSGVAKSEARVYEFDVLERQWVVQALRTQLSVLTRSRNKEMAGSEIYALRSREMNHVGNLITKMER